MTLNPALEDARFCPRCAQPATVDYPRSISCPHCGYGAYYNPKPVAAAIPTTPDDTLILLRRGFDPGKDLWTFPGGFVDLGESVEDAARREAQEELEIDVELTSLVGVYSRPEDRVVLIVFAATTHDTPLTTEEAPEVRAFTERDIPWNDLAFWSTTQALNDFLSARPRP
jgi:ADP-ribose pyrophosphatase YjhB (NUDIX family)